MMDGNRIPNQYANRLAHLYFLREVNKADAVLVFVYFLGDTTVSGYDPVTREGWEAAVGPVNEHIGLRPSSLWICENVADVFIDVNDIRHVDWS